MGDVNVIPQVDEGLGNSAYLVDLADGCALAVDASRDLRRLPEAAEKLGLTLAYAADTHLHADFLTGAVALAASDGATVLASAAGNREYPHAVLADGDEVDLGGLTLRTLATPDALMSTLLSSCSTVREPWACSPVAHTRAGSFCSAPPGAERTSTIGAERATNSLLRAGSEDTFVKQLLDSLGSFPSYFLRLPELNRRGPALVEGDILRALSAAEVASLRMSGAVVVDVRPIADFAAGHVPGSVSIALRPVFATWLGWLIAPDKPLVIVRSPDQDPAEIVWQPRKVGYDLIADELDGGMPSWTAAGQLTSSIPLINAEGIGAARVLDIRQDAEYASGHLPAADHIELGALADHAGDLRPDRSW